MSFQNSVLQAIRSVQGLIVGTQLVFKTFFSQDYTTHIAHGRISDWLAKLRPRHLAGKIRCFCEAPQGVFHRFQTLRVRVDHVVANA